jgi:O-antigen/teichoic acid export membrane protein
MSVQESKKSFFMHGGLMIVATVAGGFFMLLVQVFARNFMAAAEYSVFFTLLRVYLIMGVPAGGLQTVFTQQSASALNDDHARQLSGTTRAVLMWTFVLWLIMAAFVLATSRFWIDLLKIPKPAALWLTIFLGLASLWLPILKGLLQGRQNFTGLGWILIVDAVGRFLPVAAIFLILGGQATGAMAGVVIGQVASIGAAAWLTRKIWLGKGAPFDARAWRGRVVPLALGTGAVLIMSNADILFVQSLFVGKQDFYMVAAMVGLALTQIVTPLAVVMYPKIARSAAKSEKTDAMTLTLKASAALGCLAAVGCTLLPWLPLLVISPSDPGKNYCP